MTSTTGRSTPTTPRRLPFQRNTRRIQTKRFNSTKTNPQSKVNPPEPDPEPTSLGQRMRKLFREYGRSAFGVYILLSVLDFPVCFAAVRFLGVDRIGHYEHVVMDSMKRAWAVVAGGSGPGNGNADADADKREEGFVEGQLAQVEVEGEVEEASMLEYTNLVQVLTWQVYGRSWR